MMACLGSLLSPTPMLARTLVHYGLHFVFPLVIALLWPRRRWTVVYLLLLSTMLIDVDHLLARPIFARIAVVSGRISCTPIRW